MAEEVRRRKIDRAKKSLIVISIVLLVSNALLYLEYIRVRSELDDLKALLEKYEEVPYDYYETNSFNDHDNRLDELESFLAQEFRSPEGSKKREWDCSESSAYVEWVLEDAGFDAWIAVGRAPWNPDLGYHAWVILYTDEHSGTGVYVIEPTALTGGLAPALQYLLSREAPGLIYRDDQYEEGYYLGYEKRYKNIYWAIRDSGNVAEWDWWSGCWEAP